MSYITYPSNKNLTNMTCLTFRLIILCIADTSQMYKYMKCANVAIFAAHDASSLLTYAALHLLFHIYFHATSIFQHITSFVISKRLGLKVDCINTSWCIIKVCIVSWIYCWRLLYYCWSQRRTWVRMSSILKSGRKHLSWITLHFYQNIQHRLESGIVRLM